MTLKDADAIKAELRKRLDDGLLYTLADVIEVIDELPTIDPVKRGKWLRTPTGWAYCSVCRMEPPNESNETTDFCPNCGAKMDMEEDEER